MRTLTAASKGKVPGPEGSIGKLFGGRMMTQMGELGIDSSGRRRSRGDDDYRWHQTLLGAPAAHIAGGSDEVMKNIIGERVLGLPGEPASTRASPGRTCCARRVNASPTDMRSGRRRRAHRCRGCRRVPG